MGIHVCLYLFIRAPVVLVMRLQRRGRWRGNMHGNMANLSPFLSKTSSIVLETTVITCLPEYRFLHSTFTGAFIVIRHKFLCPLLVVFPKPNLFPNLKLHATIIPNTYGYVFV